jgi:renalase
VSDAPHNPSPRVAVIGAGVAGAAAARALHDRGLGVVALDKGRGPGGRTARRRDGALHFDHGAQYFTTRDPAFRAAVDRWIGAGAAARWDGRLVTLAPDGSASPLREEPRYVGAPGMNAIVRQELDGLDARFGVRAASLEHSGDGWLVHADDDEPLGPFDSLVLAVPAPQAAELLRKPARGLARRCEGVEIDPCWTAMVAFEDGGPDPGFDGAGTPGHPTLSWVARNASKPGRPPHDAWVVHASPAWSRANLERSRDDVLPPLVGALRDLLGRSTETIAHATAHRWRYAMASSPVGEPCLGDDDLGLVICGDWLLGPRVECAYLSGLAAADALAPAGAPA